MSIGEATDQPVAEPPARATALYTVPFIGVCLVMLLAFAQSFTLQPILPLLVFDLGGDATIIGLAFLVFTIPSVVLRPTIGRLADRLGARPVLLIGAAGVAIVGPLYLVPSLAVFAVLRLVHGTVWAAFNTGSGSTMAGLAPPARRGEASAAYDLMPGLAILIMPPIALTVYAAFGPTGAIALVTALGAACLVVALWLIPASVGGRIAGASSGGSLLEGSAILPMFFQLLLSSVLSLFVVYPPLFAAQHGIPLIDLVAYYLVYGATFVVARVIGGRIVDRIPRVSVMLLGAALAAISLLIAATATTVLVLTVAGVFYAIANGSTAPATTALVIDRAPERRLGAAMATYTLGFQLGGGLGAAAWGILIDSSGFAVPFIVGAALQLVLLGVVVSRRASLRVTAA